MPKSYLYNLIEKKQFSNDFKVCLVSEEEIFNKPGITTHLKYRKSNYRTSRPFCEFYGVVVVECEEYELYDIERLVLKITKQYHPCVDELPNNECRIGIHPEVIISIIIDACKYYKIAYKLLRGAEIQQEIDNDDFSYDAKLEERLQSHIYFKQMYDFERVCKMPELRSFQIEALEAIENVYADKNKHSIKLIIPCGTGKTVIFQEFAFRHQHEFRYIFYVTYTLKLIENMKERWKETFPDRRMIELSSSAVGNKVDIDELTGHIDLGEKFVFFICDESFRSRAKIIFDYNIIGGAKDKCLFIWDESHKLNRNVPNGNPLDVIRLPEFNDLWEKKLMFNIFCSATPVYGNYKTDNPLYMNNPDYYGVDEYRFTDLEECIKAGFICPMKLVIKKDSFDVSSRFVSKDFKMNDDDFKGLEKGMKVASCAKYCKRKNIIKCLNTLYSLLADTSLSYKPSKVIIYCTFIKEVNEFFNALSLMKEECEFLQDFKLFKLYSSSTGDMDKALHEFTNYRGKSIMINIRMLNDGINVPDIDTILFTSPTGTKPDIIQRIFRARRTLITRPDKIAYIVIPVGMYDIKDEMYDMILKVLQELIEANDPSVIMLKRKYKERGEKTSGIKSDSEPENVFETGLVDPEIQHSIVTDIGNLFMTTNINAAIMRAIQLYPMNVSEICEYINFNQLLNMTVSYDNCNEICKGMAARNKIFYDEKTGKYYSDRDFDFDESEREYNEFIEKMNTNQITNETDFNGYCERVNYVGIPINPIWYFRKFKFNWSIVRPIEEKVYGFNVCKDIITQLLENEEIRKQVMSINGYVKRIKFLREKDRHIPHQDTIKKYYKIKNMVELHKLLKESSD